MSELGDGDLRSGALPTVFDASFTVPDELDDPCDLDRCCAGKGEECEVSRMSGFLMVRIRELPTVGVVS